MENKFKQKNNKNLEDNKLYIDFLKSCEIEQNLFSGSAISPTNRNSNNSNSNSNSNTGIQINKNGNSFSDYPGNPQGNNNNIINNNSSISGKVSNLNSAQNLKKPKSNTVTSGHNLNYQQTQGANNNNNVASTNTNTNTIHNSQATSFFDFMLKKHNQIHSEFEQTKAAKAAEEKFNSQRALRRAKSLLSGNSTEPQGILPTNTNLEHGSSSLTKEETLKIVFKNDQCIQWFKVKIVPLLLQEPLLAISLQDITSIEEEKKIKRVEQENLHSSLQIIAKVRNHLEFIYSNLGLFKHYPQLTQAVTFPLHIIRSTASIDKTKITYSPFPLSTLFRELYATFDNLQAIKFKVIFPEETQENQIDSKNYLNLMNQINFNNYSNKNDLKNDKLYETQEDSQICKGCDQECQGCGGFTLNNNNKEIQDNDLNSGDGLEDQTEYEGQEEDFEEKNFTQDSSDQQKEEIIANMSKYNMISIDQIISAQNTPHQSVPSFKNLQIHIPAIITAGTGTRVASNQKIIKDKVSSCVDLKNPKNHQILLRSKSEKTSVPKGVHISVQDNIRREGIPKASSQDNLIRNFHQMRNIQRRSTYSKNAKNNVLQQQQYQKKQNEQIINERTIRNYRSLSPNDKIMAFQTNLSQRSEPGKCQPQFFVFPGIPGKYVEGYQQQQIQQLQLKNIKGQISQLVENPDEEESCASGIAETVVGMKNQGIESKQGLVSSISVEETQQEQQQQRQQQIQQFIQDQQNQYQHGIQPSMFSPASSTGQNEQEDSQQQFDSMSFHHKYGSDSLNRHQQELFQQQQQYLQPMQQFTGRTVQQGYEMNTFVALRSSVNLEGSDNSKNPLQNSIPELQQKINYNTSPTQQAISGNLESYQQQQQQQEDQRTQQNQQIQQPQQEQLPKQQEKQQQQKQQTDLILISNYRLLLQALSGLCTTFQDNKIEIMVKIMHRKLYSSIRFILKAAPTPPKTSTPLVQTNPSSNVENTTNLKTKNTNDGNSNNKPTSNNPTFNPSNPLTVKFDTHEYSNTQRTPQYVSPRLSQQSYRYNYVLSPQQSAPTQQQLAQMQQVALFQQLQLPPLPFQGYPSPRQPKIPQATRARLPSARQPPGSSRKRPKKLSQQMINTNSIPKSVSIASRSSIMITEEDFIRNLYGLNFKISKQLCMRIWRSIKEIASIMGPESLEISQNCIEIEFFLDMNVVNSQNQQKQQMNVGQTDGLQNTYVKPSRNSLFSQHFNNGLVTSPQSPLGSTQNITTATNLNNLNYPLNNAMNSNNGLISENQSKNYGNNQNAQHFFEFTNNAARKNSGNVALNSPKNISQLYDKQQQPNFQSYSSFSSQDVTLNPLVKRNNNNNITNNINQKKIPPSITIQSSFNDPFISKMRILRLPEVPDSSQHPQQNDLPNSSTHLSLLSLQSSQDERVKDIQLVKDFLNQPAKFSGS